MDVVVQCLTFSEIIPEDFGDEATQHKTPQTMTPKTPQSQKSDIEEEVVAVKEALSMHPLHALTLHTSPMETLPLARYAGSTTPQPNLFGQLQTTQNPFSRTSQAQAISSLAPQPMAALQALAASPFSGNQGLLSLTQSPTLAALQAMATSSLPLQQTTLLNADPIAMLLNQALMPSPSSTLIQALMQSNLARTYLGTPTETQGADNLIRLLNELKRKM
jgi:hypothetical protein